MVHSGQIRASVPGTLIASITTHQPCLVMLMGAPGSGKTTLAGALADRLGNGVAVLSYAAHRAEVSVSGDPSDPTADRAAGALLRERLRDRCAAGLTTIVDGTHHLAHTRAALLGIAADTGLAAVAVVLSTPLAVCLDRQWDRPLREPGDRITYRVPQPEVRQVARAIQDARGDLADEGFLVHVLRPDDTGGMA